MGGTAPAERPRSGANAGSAGGFCYQREDVAAEVGDQGGGTVLEPHVRVEQGPAAQAADFMPDIRGFVRESGACGPHEHVERSAEPPFADGRQQVGMSRRKCLLHAFHDAEHVKPPRVPAVGDTAGGRAVVV